MGYFHPPWRQRGPSRRLAPTAVQIEIYESRYPCRITRSRRAPRAPRSLSTVSRTSSWACCLLKAWLLTAPPACLPRPRRRRTRGGGICWLPVESRGGGGRKTTQWWHRATASKTKQPISMFRRSPWLTRVGFRNYHTEIWFIRKTHTHTFFGWC